MQKEKGGLSKAYIVTGVSVPQDLIPSDDRNAGNLVRHLPLSVGSRYMLTQNINTYIH